MKKINLNFLKEEHKGIGGLYFIFSSITCAFILTNILRMSYSSNVSEIINNGAFIVASDALAISYMNYCQSYESDGYAPFSYPAIDNRYIDCNEELNNIISDWTEVASAIECNLKYTANYDNTGRGLGSKIRLEYKPIKLKNFDITITPSVQEIVIE